MQSDRVIGRLEDAGMEIGCRLTPDPSLTLVSNLPLNSNPSIRRESHTDSRSSNEGIPRLCGASVDTGVTHKGRSSASEKDTALGGGNRAVAKAKAD